MVLIFNFTLLTLTCFFGDHSEEVPPVPIPNTEVKLFSADGTAWETVWESRSSPFFIENPFGLMLKGVFCFVPSLNYAHPQITRSDFQRLLLGPAANAQQQACHPGLCLCDEGEHGHPHQVSHFLLAAGYLLPLFAAIFLAKVL